LLSLIPPLSTPPRVGISLLLQVYAYAKYNLCIPDIFWYFSSCTAYNIPKAVQSGLYNSLDLVSFMSEDVKTVQRQFDLITPDYLIIYTRRFTTGKKLKKVAALAGAIKKKSEKSVRVLFCNFPCMDIEPEKYKAAIITIGCFFGLKKEDMAFTSDMGYPQGFPRGGVLELFTLSNLFIFPAYSESFGLTVLEAASRKFLVLTRPSPHLRKQARTEAYFRDGNARNFGFDPRNPYKPNEQFYLEEHTLES
jgi:hypothetical protein